MNKQGLVVRFLFAFFALLVVAACGSPVSSFETSMQQPPEYMLEGLLPTLTPPEGAQQMGGGGGGGGYAALTGMFFLSDLGIDEVTQHFEDQLTEAGWRFISEQSEDDEVTVFWELTDPDGGIWSGKLDVVFSPPDFENTYRVEVGILLPQNQ